MVRHIVRVALPRLVCVALALMFIGACGGEARHATSSTASASAPSAATATSSASSASQAAPVSDGDWPQFNDDDQRTGVAPGATGITPGTVHELSRTVVHIDGTVDASVIQLHDLRVAGRVRDVLFTTTTYGRTIALDARTGAKLWEYSPPGTSDLLGSPQVTNATPTADPDRGAIYVTDPHGIVRKLAVASGRVVWSRRVLLNPDRQKLASPITVSGASVVVVTDGYNGDAPPYQGHVVTLRRSTGAIEHVFNTLCSNRPGLIEPGTCPDSDSAIWGRAGALIAPGTHDILVATGNGPFNGTTNWGDSVLELSPDAGRLLHNWTPANQSTLNSDDLDLGSASPALLPGGLLLQGGKGNALNLLDLDRLDGTAGHAGPRLGGELQTIASPGHNEVKTQPVVWSHHHRTWVFVADDSGTTGYILSGGAHPRLSVSWQSSHPGTSPVLAGGLLYVYDELGGQLEVLSPTSGHIIDSLHATTGHWNSPIVIGGRVVLPVGSANEHATSGEIFVWHLPGR
jgi:outer membrane protein assembly factor BamB